MHEAEALPVADEHHDVSNAAHVRTAEIVDDLLRLGVLLKEKGPAQEAGE